MMRARRVLIIFLATRLLSAGYIVQPAPVFKRPPKTGNAFTLLVDGIAFLVYISKLNMFFNYTVQ